jgi:ADP-heptose:LPS heptosyltransferase
MTSESRQRKGFGLSRPLLRNLKKAMSQPTRIMLIQLRRIGDVLMCTPALRVLRQSFPQSFIAFLTERECQDVLASNPYLDEVIILDREKYRNPWYWLRKVGQIRKKKFDLVIDYLCNPRSAYLSFLSGAKHRIGYDLPRRRFFYNMLVKSQAGPRYSAEHKLEALRALGIEASDLKLDFFIPDEAGFLARDFFQEQGIDRSRLIVSVSATSRRRFRRWPPERFARLADWLISKFKATVILVWGPGEREAVEKVQAVMGERPVISRETENLFQLGAILGRCDIHIGNDNGTKHIAVAMGRPTITIYGPQDPKSWTYPDPSRHKFLKTQQDCPDCDKIKHRCTELACLDRITVQEVQRAFLELLKDLEKSQERSLAEKIEYPAID